MEAREWPWQSLNRGQPKEGGGEEEENQRARRRFMYVL